MKYCWHKYHNLLVSAAGNMKKRREEIKNNVRIHSMCIDLAGNFPILKRKLQDEEPELERKIHLHLIKLVLGQLPKRWLDAEGAKQSAKKAWWDAVEKAERGDITAKKVLEAAKETRWDTKKAEREAYEACKAEIEALHKAECPNCPWDGKTIFRNVRFTFGGGRSEWQINLLKNVQEASAKSC